MGLAVGVLRCLARLNMVELYTKGEQLAPLHEAQMARQLTSEKLHSCKVHMNRDLSDPHRWSAQKHEPKSNTKRRE
jgi:hypothetical protein